MGSDGINSEGRTVWFSNTELVSGKGLCKLDFVIQAISPIDLPKIRFILLTLLIKFFHWGQTILPCLIIIKTYNRLPLRIISDSTSSGEVFGVFLMMLHGVHAEICLLLPPWVVSEGMGGINKGVLHIERLVEVSVVGSVEL